MSHEQLLEVKNLKTTFLSEEGSVYAVRGIDFSVAKGESLGIVGESGCGKSVTMLSVLRLLTSNARSSADFLSFEGEDLLKKSKTEMRAIRGKKIGMIFQDPMTSLNPVYSVGNQIYEPLKIHMNIRGAAARQKAIELLKLVEISSPESRLKQFPHEFSGGMRQRTMIAIALCCNPQLLIADEPTTALDVTIQAQILELMNGLKEKLHMSIILITHDLGVIASMCTRIIVMYGGLIVEEASADELFENPVHPYTQGLMGSRPQAGEGGKAKKLSSIPGSPPDLLAPPKGCPFAPRCRKAMLVCKEYMPDFSQVSDSHKVACWLRHPKAITRMEAV